MDVPPNSSAAANSPTGARAYDDMILAAIAAMNSTGGSSREAISDYIQDTYSELPTRHPLLLNNHLRILKESGRIVMSKNLYRLPEAEGSVPRKRGRPLKIKEDRYPYPAIVHVPSPDVTPTSDEAAEPKPEPEPEPEHEPEPEPEPQSQPPRRGRGRPATNKNSRAAAASAVSAGVQTRGGRGRLQKLNAVEGAATEKSPARGRGRPTRSSSTIEPSAAAAAQHVHIVDYEILQQKVKIIQTRIKDAVAILKPHLVGEGSASAMGAIVELEAIAAMDVKIPSNADMDETPS